MSNVILMEKPYLPSIEAAEFDFTNACNEYEFSSHLHAAATKDTVFHTANYLRAARDRMWAAQDILRDVKYRALGQKLEAVWR